MKALKKLDLDQAIIISGYTGVLCCNFYFLQMDIEKRLGRPVWTHELGNKLLAEKVKELYTEDFLRICNDQEDENDVDNV